MDEERLRIEYLPISALTPYERNTRAHAKDDVDAIALSIKKYGMNDPIGVWSEKNIIVEGHGRLLACKKLRMKEVPVVHLDHMTDEERREYAIMHNKTAELSSWDFDNLVMELSEIDLSDFGDDLFNLRDAGLNKDEGEEDNFDVDAELQKPAFSMPGDIWHLGRHTVICGDSTNPATFEALLGDTKVNLVCTDAPYFVDLQSKSGTIANDNLDDTQAYDFLMSAFTNFKNAMAKDASIYEFYATMKTRVFYDAFEDAGFRVGAGLIWKKPRAPFMRTDWKFNMEPIIFGWRKDGKHVWYGDQKQTSIFEFDSIKDSATDGFGHPSSKPVPLIAYLIQQSTQTNGLVLDGFLGSASTLIACEQIGRTCYGVELEQKYVDVAVKRYIKWVGSDDEVYVIRGGEKKTLAEVEDPIAGLEMDV